MRPALTVTHVVAALAALLLLGVADSARRAYGMSFPSALFTAEGRFAAVFLPDWGVAGAPIEHGDLVLAVDGAPVSPLPGEPPGRAIYRLVAGRSRAGAQHVSVAYLHDGARRTLVLPVRRVGPRELWFFALLVPLAGAIYLASGLLVHRLAGRHPAGRAYLLSCGATFVTLAASFDYVTTARLQPLFPVSAALVSLALVWTVYAFPHRPLRARPGHALRAALLALAAVAAWAVAAALGVDPRVLRLVTWAAGFAGLLVLGAALASRLGYTTHAARSPRFAVGWILAIVPVCWGSLLFGLARGGDAQHLLAPFVFLAVPMSVDYSLLRHHVLDVPGDRLLRILAASTTLWALLIGATVGWAVGAMSLPVGAGAALPVAAGVAVVAAMLALAPRVLRGLYFSTTARFQPTVERLGDVLAEHTDRASIEAALAEHVTRLTTAEGVRVLGPDALAGVDPALRGALAAGRHVLRGDESERALLVPMRCRAELQGVLSVPVLGDDAGHTGEDLALLGTVASLGAIALRHAAVVAELEALRRAEVGATRDDRDLAVDRSAPRSATRSRTRCTTSGICSGRSTRATPSARRTSRSDVTRSTASSGCCRRCAAWRSRPSRASRCGCSTPPSGHSACSVTSPGGAAWRSTSPAGSRCWPTRTPSCRCLPTSYATPSRPRGRAARWGCAPASARGDSSPRCGTPARGWRPISPRASSPRG